jgi:hypothetical protein
MAYFTDEILDVIVTGIDSLATEDVNGLELVISSLQDESNNIGFEINKWINEYGRSENDPTVSYLYTTRDLIDSFGVLFDLYYTFLIDGYESYYDWFYEFNEYYNIEPIEIFDSITLPDGIITTSNEYDLFLELKSYIDPNSSDETTSDPTSQILYYIIPNSTDVQRIQSTGRLTMPVSGDTFFFFDSIDDLKRYHMSVFPFEVDESVDPSVLKKSSRVFIAECEAPSDIIERYTYNIGSDLSNVIINNLSAGSNSEIPISIIGTEYIGWIRAWSVDEILVTPIIRNTNRPRRAKLGTG